MHACSSQRTALAACPLMSRPIRAQAGRFPVARLVRPATRFRISTYSSIRCQASSAAPQQQQQQQQQRFPTLAAVDWPLTLAFSGILSAIVYGLTVLLKSQARLVIAAILVPLLAFLVGRESTKHRPQVNGAASMSIELHMYQITDTYECWLLAGSI